MHSLLKTILDQPLVKLLLLNQKLVLASVAIFLTYSLWPRTHRNLAKLTMLSRRISYLPLLNRTNGFIDIHDKVISSIPRNARRMFMRHLGMMLVVQTATPEAAKALMDTELFQKMTFINRTFFGYPSFPGYLFGENIVASNGDEWHRHRSVIKPAFAKPIRVPVFVASVSQLISTFHNLSDKSSVQIYPWMQRLTLDVLGRAIFTFDFHSLDDVDGGPYVALWEKISTRLLRPIFIVFPFLAYLPTKWNRESWKFCREFHDLLMRMIVERKKDIANGKVKEEKDKDLLDLMIEAANIDNTINTEWTSKDLMNNLAVFFVAGHDTTSNALSAAIYFLACDETAQDRARNEVYSVLGKPNNREEAVNVGPEQSQLGRLTYINAIIKEALRMFPSAPILGLREARKDVPITFQDIDGKVETVVIPKGQIVSLDILAMHHDPVYFPEPEKFNPDRWLNDESERKPWMPFGGGPRQCIGMQFSLLEQKVALAMLLRNFEFSLKKLPDGSLPEYKTASSSLLRPAGLNVTLAPII